MTSGMFSPRAACSAPARASQRIQVDRLVANLERKAGNALRKEVNKEAKSLGDRRRSAKMSGGCVASLRARQGQQRRFCTIPGVIDSGSRGHATVATIGAENSGWLTEGRGFDSNAGL